MCVGSATVADIGSRDTSNELVKSNYELSEENKKKNAEIRARNKARSLVSFSGGDDGGPIVDGIPFSGKTKSSTNSGYDFTNTA